MPMYKQTDWPTPTHAIQVSTYTDLKRYLARFAEGRLNLVILLGRPGTGKTTAAREAVGLSSSRGTSVSGPLYIEGHMQAFGLYQALWEHCDRSVILDDLDRLYTHQDCLRILKALCNTHKVKSLSWVSNNTRDSTGIPSSFETTSNVMLIGNTWATVNDSVRALEDRAIVLDFCPDKYEVHRYVGEWFDDAEVYAFIGEHLEIIPSLSIRFYDKGRMLSRAGMSDWHQALLGMMVPDPRMALVIALLADPELPTDRARVERFVQATGLSRPTYYRLKRQIKVLAGLETEGTDTSEDDTNAETEIDDETPPDGA